MTSTNSVRRALNTNHIYFETNLTNLAKNMKDGQTTSWLNAKPEPVPISTESADIDLALAFGKMDVISEGNFDVKNDADTYFISGKVIHYVKDLYNFNPGDEFPPRKYLKDLEEYNIYLESLKADDINLLKCKRARDFTQLATWDEDLQAEGKLSDLDRELDPKVWKWTVIID